MTKTKNDRVAELEQALQRAIDMMEGMLLGARILRGERGTLRPEPSPEIERLRAVLRGDER